MRRERCRELGCLVQRAGLNVPLGVGSLENGSAAAEATMLQPVGRRPTVEVWKGRRTHRSPSRQEKNVLATPPRLRKAAAGAIMMGKVKRRAD